MPVSSINVSGIAAQQCVLVLPNTGVFHADVLLQTTTPTSGPVVLTLGNATYQCTVYRAVSFEGARSLRLVGGAGGWAKQLPAQQYANPAGVSSALVLADAAAAVGELPPNVPASILGPFYVRPRQNAGQLLNDLLSEGWYVDNTGVVQPAPRPATTITSPFIAEKVRGSSGLYTITTETPEDWVPGASFSNQTISGTIGRVMIRADKNSVRVEVVAA